MNEEKYIDIATFEKPKITYLGKYTLLDDLVEKIKNTKSVDSETIKDLCICFKIIYESKGEDLNE